MNERIKELLKQATTTHYSGMGERDEVDQEKFAELIVLECVNAVMDDTKEGDHYAQKIEEHFDSSQGGILHYGIEE